MEPKTFSVLTFNASQCKFRYFWKTWVKSAGFLNERFASLPAQLQQTDADLICVQELFNRNWKRDLRKELAEAICKTHPYAALDGPPGRWWTPSQGSGLSIFSKRPLYASGFIPFGLSSIGEQLFATKGYLVTKCDMLGYGTIRLTNAHTVSGYYPEAKSNEYIRRLQQERILESLDQERSRIDILCGDFNHSPTVSEANYRQVLEAGFTDAFEMGGGTGNSWDNKNPFVSIGIHGHCRSQRMDHIFFRGSVIQPVRAEIVLKERVVNVLKSELVPLSDHYGVQVWFNAT